MLFSYKKIPSRVSSYYAIECTTVRTHKHWAARQAVSVSQSCLYALKLKFGTTAFISLLADRPTLWQFSSHHPKMINAFSNYYINIVAKAPPPDETMIREATVIRFKCDKLAGSFRTDSLHISRNTDVQGDNIYNLIE